MRKTVKKLALNKETLRVLDEGSKLARVAGGESEAAGLCDPSVGVGNTECETRCLPCPLRPPTVEN
jgi:hypothetical protein